MEDKKTKKATRKCLECKAELRGRADQKYCSDTCRVAFHNRENKDGSKFMANISRILRKNRRILKGLFDDKRTRVSQTTLLDEGFNFHYITNTYTTKKEGKVYRFCFEYGYLPLSKGYFLIVERKTYIV